ncbi:MAG: hypothetical protein QOD86_2823, partial [Miltoncostaeaceae bacterium]|nr:hypothetical protein [Miltoncostaeaceae bacterium]
LPAWARSWRQARDQGARGALLPNRVVQPGQSVRFRVPDGPVHGYVLRGDVHGADAAALAERLTTVGVRVLRLTADASAAGFRGYGEPAAGPATIAAGSYYVPLAQPAKHWVQAMLGQDAFVPFPYFYDVSSWSNPLLMGLAGGWSERPLPADAVALDAPASPAGPAADAPAYAFAGDSVGALALATELLVRGAAVVREPVGGAITASGVGRDELTRLAGARRVELRGVDGPPAGAVALRTPRVALLAVLAPVITGSAGPENSDIHASHGWTRFVLAQRLGVAADVLGDAELAAGRLRDGGYTALVVADGQLPAGALGADALAQVQAFVAAGGTFVGVRRLGLAVARAAGISTVAVRPAPPGFRVPGTTFAVTVDGRDPLGWGAGGPGFQLDVGDPILTDGGGAAVVRYDPGGRRVSGYAARSAVLGGTPALVDATFGAGRVALFASDPSFRAYVEAGQRLLGNALLAPPPAPVAALRTAVSVSRLASAGARRSAASRRSAHPR